MHTQDSVAHESDPDLYDHSATRGFRLVAVRISGPVPKLRQASRRSAPRMPIPRPEAVAKAAPLDSVASAGEAPTFALSITVTSAMTGMRDPR
jgi:hypothetical protein